MKTIFDAVNEFKGEWGNVDHNKIKSEYIFIHSGEGSTWKRGELVGDVINHSPTVFNKLCTKEEFNALVEEMKNNFGKCLDYQYIAYQLAVKQLLEPVNTLTIGGNYEFSDDNINWEGGELISISYSVPLTYQSKSGNKHEWYAAIREVKQASNTYTQEMADNGVFPSVGMEVLFKHGGCDVNGVVAGITNEFIVLTEKSGKERVRKLSESPIKPLTPPVPLIDGKAYQFECNGHKNVNGIYNDDGYFIDHNANAYIDCTNIQPLTLAGE